MRGEFTLEGHLSPLYASDSTVVYLYAVAPEPGSSYEIPISPALAPNLLRHEHGWTALPACRQHGSRHPNKVYPLHPTMTPTRPPQTPPSDDKDKEATQIVTFTWDAATLALGRYRSAFFLVYANEHRLLEPGKRFHSSLNVVSSHSNRHSKKGPKVASFWLNCSRGNGDAEDPNGVYYQLLNADPPMVRRTGRKRKEVSADNGASTIDCHELEVLVPEGGLIRQCYYCLSWEDDGLRYSQIKYDKYWCSKVRVSSKSAQPRLWLTKHSVRRKGVFCLLSPRRKSREYVWAGIFTTLKERACMYDV